MNLLEVSNICKTYGSSEAAAQVFNLIPELTVEQAIIMITHNRGIVQTADRVFNVSDGVLADLGRCCE